MLSTGCQPNATPEAADPDVASPAVPVKNIPDPVKSFELYCYRTEASYEKGLEIATSMQLKPIPDRWKGVMQAQEGGGKGFIIARNKEEKKIQFLGLSDLNTCAVYSNGYVRDEIVASLMENYHLKSAIKDDTGLQVNEMLVPNGVKGTIGEAHENGLVGIMYAKDPDDTGMTISFMAPETVKKNIPL